MRFVKSTEEQTKRERISRKGSIIGKHFRRQLNK
jgi:hypothetical protein